MYLHNGQQKLYCVKREFAEEYHSGGSSYLGIKMYNMGGAKTVARDLNRYLYGNELHSPAKPLLSKDEWIKHPSIATRTRHVILVGNRYQVATLDEAYEYYLYEKNKGKWIIAELQFSSSPVVVDEKELVR